MAHITAYVPAHLFRRYQEEWPRDESFSAWLQSELARKLDTKTADALPAGTSIS